MTLRINGSTSGYAEIDSPAVGGNNTIVLPSGNGSANQLLKNGATAGTLEYASVTADGTALGSVASINNGPLAGMRNAIINGNFDIWQRGTSFTGSEYGADRWVSSRSGSTHTATRQSFTLGQTDVPGEPEYFLRTAVTSVAGASNFNILRQYIESVKSFAGQQITVSFWAKADATKNIAIEFTQSFGTGGSPSAEVTAIGSVKKTLTTSWQKITHTVTIPSISGKTLGSDGNDILRLFIWFDAGSSFNARTDTLGQQSGTFDIAQVQVEPGPIATQFERRPIGMELSLCQRYFYKNTSPNFISRTRNYAAGASEVYFFYVWPVTLRANPAVTATGDIDDGASFTGWTVSIASKDNLALIKGGINTLQFVDLTEVIASAEL